MKTEMIDVMETVKSESDGRTVNNGVRHAYRVLSDKEKADMVEVKDLGAAFIAKLHEVGGTDPSGTSFASRDLSLANTSRWCPRSRGVRSGWAASSSRAVARSLRSPARLRS